MEQDDSNQKLDSEYVCSCIKKLIPSIRVVQEDVLATLLAKKPEPAQLRAAVIDKLNRKIPSHHRNAVYEVHIPSIPSSHPDPSPTHLRNRRITYFLHHSPQSRADPLRHHRNHPTPHLFKYSLSLSFSNLFETFSTNTKPATF